MLDRKIIAQNITNLTDARYFAAWGVDYISFNIIPESAFYVTLDTIKEIKDWVEGPDCLVESNALEFLEFADGHILSNIYSSLPLNKVAFFRVPYIDVIKGLPAGKYIVKASDDQLSNLKNLPNDKLIGLDMYLDVTDLPIDNFDAWPDWGFVIQGGDEEKTGLKSYDDLDKLYDLLMP